MGKMIGLAREENGFYLLEKARGTCSTKSQLPMFLLSESLSSHNKDLWLCHYRLGHPSFSTLKIMFPSLFQRLGIGLSPDLLRMVVQEKREIKLHQEETELVNLGTDEEIERSQD